MLRRSQVDHQPEIQSAGAQAGPRSSRWRHALSRTALGAAALAVLSVALALPAVASAESADVENGYSLLELLHTPPTIPFAGLSEASIDGQGHVYYSTLFSGPGCSAGSALWRHDGVSGTSIDTICGTRSITVVAVNDAGTHVAVVLLFGNTLWEVWRLDLEGATFDTLLSFDRNDTNQDFLELSPRLAINDAGWVAVLASLRGGGQAQMLLGDGPPQEIARSSPDLFTFGAPHISEDGSVVFKAQPSVGPQLVHLWDGASLLPLDRPECPGGSAREPILNERGTVLADCGAPALLYFTGNGVVPTPVVLGTEAPVLSSLQWGLALNDFDEIAFQSDVSTSGCSECGIFIGPDPVGDAVVRSGAEVFGGVVEDLRVGRYQWLNNRGQMAFLVQTQDGTRIVRADPPARDFGDAPSPYPTALTDDGARHQQVPGLFPGGVPLKLGAALDAEPDGQPSPGADGDDTDGSDDEDGIVFVTPLVPGQSASVDVTASGNGFLNAWLDFNGDGDWGDGGEAIFTNEPVSLGSQSLVFTVPSGATPGATFARFRLSADGGDSFDGQATSGEVEDYQVAIDSAGPMVDLKVNGEDAVFPDFVTTTGPTTLTLDMTAGTEPLFHYFAIALGETVWWLKPDGTLSLTPVPLTSFTPVPLVDVVILDATLPAGAWAFAWLMVDAAGVVASDVIVAAVTG